MAKEFSREIYVWKDAVDPFQCFVGIKSAHHGFSASMSTDVDGLYDCFGEAVDDWIKASPPGQPLKLEVTVKLKS